jgi:hypothetical protein
VLTANNRDAKVTRTYNTNGSLATERQKVRTWAWTGNSTDFDKHDYLLQFTYDFNGRRTAVQHPDQLLPRDAGRTVYSTTAYAFDTLTGRLATVTDPFGQLTKYFFSPRGDLDSLARGIPAGGGTATVTEAYTYVLDGMDSLQTVKAAAYNTGPIVNARLTFDGVGRTATLLDSISWSAQTTYYTYSGLGMLDSAYQYRCCDAGNQNVAAETVWSEIGNGKVPMALLLFSPCSQVFIDRVYNGNDARLKEWWAILCPNAVPRRIGEE